MRTIGAYTVRLFRQAVRNEVACFGQFQPSRLRHLVVTYVKNLREASV